MATPPEGDILIPSTELSARRRRWRTRCAFSSQPSRARPLPPAGSHGSRLAASRSRCRVRDIAELLSGHRSRRLRGVPGRTRLAREYGDPVMQKILAGGLLRRSDPDGHGRRSDPSSQRDPGRCHRPRRRGAGWSRRRRHAGPAGGLRGSRRQQGTGSQRSGQASLGQPPSMASMAGGSRPTISRLSGSIAPQPRWRGVRLRGAGERRSMSSRSPLTAAASVTQWFDEMGDGPLVFVTLGTVFARQSPALQADRGRSRRPAVRGRDRPRTRHPAGGPGQGSREHPGRCDAAAGPEPRARQRGRKSRLLQHGLRRARRRRTAVPPADGGRRSLQRRALYHGWCRARRDQAAAHQGHHRRGRRRSRLQIPRVIREGTRRLLEEPAFREAARVVAAEIAAMPPADYAAERLVAVLEGQAARPHGFGAAVRA